MPRYSLNIAALFPANLLHPSVFVRKPADPNDLRQKWLIPC